MRYATEVLLVHLRFVGSRSRSGPEMQDFGVDSVLPNIPLHRGHFWALGLEKPNSKHFECQTSDDFSITTSLY